MPAGRINAHAALKHSRVETHQVLSIPADAFKYVNFSAAWPIGSKHPNYVEEIIAPKWSDSGEFTSWPHTTRTVWHVRDVPDEQSTTPTLLSRDPHALPSLGTDFERRSVIYGHVCWNTRPLRNQACVLRIGLRDILDKSIGRICVLEVDQQPDFDW